jgi:hypothetical protein
LRLPAFRETFAAADVTDMPRLFTQFVGYVSAAIRPLLENDHAVFVRQTIDFVAATDKTFNHKLGKQPVGWTVVDASATGDIHRVAWNDKTITLQSTTTRTLTIEVF